MVKRGTLASAGGPRPSTETGIARAETLGPDGGQRIWKPGPDAAAGPTGAQESAPILFPSGSMHSGNSGGARGGGPRGMGEEEGRDATRDAAACGSSGGGAGEHGRDVRRTIARCAGGRQQHGAGRGQLLNTEY